MLLGGESRVVVVVVVIYYNKKRRKGGRADKKKRETSLRISRPRFYRHFIGWKKKCNASKRSRLCLSERSVGKNNILFRSPSVLKVSLAFRRSSDAVIFVIQSYIKSILLGRARRVCKVNTQQLHNACLRKQTSGQKKKLLCIKRIRTQKLCQTCSMPIDPHYEILRLPRRIGNRLAWGEATALGERGREGEIYIDG